jgi:hypothetical protein
MKNGDQMNQDAKRQLQLPDRVTRILMQHSRRGFLGWCGKIGIALVGGTIGLNISPSFASGTTGPAATTPDLGCSECTGACDPCTSSCCCPCSTRCVCACLAGCYECIPQFFKAHLLWILGYIPNCTCPGC